MLCHIKHLSDGEASTEKCCAEAHLLQHQQEWRHKGGRKGASTHTAGN